MGKLRVLMYHKVDESRRDFLTVSVAQLKEQLQYVSENYTVIRLSELLNHFNTGTALPENAVLVTFDDGYANNYDLAYPVFKALNMPFSIFLVSDFVGKTVLYDEQQQQFLSVSQLAAMQDLADFGYHSVAHRNLMQLSENEWEDEISGCVTDFKALGISVLGAWAYTYGSFPKKDPDKLKQFEILCRKYGIQCAFRIGNRLNKVPVKQPFAIERLDIRGEMPLPAFRRRLKFGKIF